jgi:hypothetical protein
MTGQHRSTTQDRTRSALKSAVALLQIAGVVLALPVVLGLLAFGIYETVAHWSDAYPVAIAYEAAAWLMVSADLAVTVRRNRPRSPAQVVAVVRGAANVAFFSIILLITIGRWQGWANGSVRWVLIGISTLILVYTLAGQRYLRTFLESRAASRPHPS